MELIDQFRYLVGGYYGVEYIDEYDLKVYVLKDIENYIKDFVEINPIDNFDYEKEALLVKDNVIKLDEDILSNSEKGIETKINYREKIGEKIC